MYVDAQGLFSDAQAVTTTEASTNIINTGGDHNLGIGEPMAVVIIVDVALDDVNADETYVVSLETDTVEAMSSIVTLASFTAARGDAAGTRYVLSVPPSTNNEQFLRVMYTHGGTSPTGTYTAFLIPQSMIQNDVAYADAITIS